jgi:hypothetical protein
MLAKFESVTLSNGYHTWFGCNSLVRDLRYAPLCNRFHNINVYIQKGVAMTSSTGGRLNV